MISVVITLAVEVTTTGVLWCLDFVFLVLVFMVVGVGELVAGEDVGVLAVEEAGCVELGVELGLRVEVGFEEVVGVEVEGLLLLLLDGEELV